MTSRRLGLWAPGLNPSNPGVPGFVSLDSPFLQSDIERALATAGSSSRLSSSVSCTTGPRVVIYAGALKAFCAARGLMDLGVAPGRISLVQPSTRRHTSGVARSTSNAARAASSTTTAAAGGGQRGPEKNEPSARSGSTATGAWSLGDANVDSAVLRVAMEAGIHDAGKRHLEGIKLDSEGAVTAAVFAFKADAVPSGGATDGENGGASDFERGKIRQVFALVMEGEGWAGGGGREIRPFLS